MCRSKSIYKVVLIVSMNYFLACFLKLFSLFLIENKLYYSVNDKTHDTMGKYKILHTRSLFLFSNSALCSRDSNCSKNCLADGKFFLWNLMRKCRDVPTTLFLESEKSVFKMTFENADFLFCSFYGTLGFCHSFI